MKPPTFTFSYLGNSYILFTPYCYRFPVYYTPLSQEIQGLIRISSACFLFLILTSVCSPPNSPSSVHEILSSECSSRQSVLKASIMSVLSFALRSAAIISFNYRRLFGFLISVTSNNPSFISTPGPIRFLNPPTE